MARIVLDTDAVSLYRAGHLPTGVARQVVTNDISIAFATAGELWKGALAKRWGGARRGGLDLWLAEMQILTADLRVAKLGPTSPCERSDVGGPDRCTTPGSRPAVSRPGCHC